ncbi:MAG: DNA repair protein RecO [Phycisphaeraceae bacterium]|nr:MAG: DNA repair protein RecO [Phycisphaeraceae bacterium]
MVLAGPPAASLRAGRRIDYAHPVPGFVDQALVVRVWDWSETSQTVSLFCQERGLLRAVAKGARREKGRFSGGLDLLTRGEVVGIQKSGAEMATLTDWTLQEIFWAGRNDLKRHYTGLYILDTIQRLLSEADPHPKLWNQALKTLRRMEEPDVDVGAALLEFQWILLVETGHRPDVRGGRFADTETMGFDPQAGGLISDPGAGARDNGPWRVRLETVRLMRSLEAPASSEADSPEAGESGDAVDRANRLLATYIGWLLGREPPVLKLLFPSGTSPRVRKT